MRIFRRTFREYISLLTPLLGFIAAVWALRLVLAAAGAPLGVVKIASVTVAENVAILLAAVLIHTRRFGGYANLVAAVFLLVLWQELLISAAIAFSMATGTHNIYTAPEFNPPHFLAESQTQHLIAHLTFGVGFGTLFGAAIGCVLLFMIKRLVRLESAR